MESLSIRLLVTSAIIFPHHSKHLSEVYDTFSVAERLREAGFEDVESIAAASTPINKSKYRDQECATSMSTISEDGESNWRQHKHTLTFK